MDDEYVGEYQTLMEQEIFDYVLFEVSILGNITLWEFIDLCSRSHGLCDSNAICYLFNINEFTPYRMICDDMLMTRSADDL